MTTVTNRRNDVERQNCVYSANKGKENKKQLDKESTQNTNREKKERNDVPEVRNV